MHHCDNTQRVYLPLLECQTSLLLSAVVWKRMPYISMCESGHHRLLPIYQFVRRTVSVTSFCHQPVAIVPGCFHCLFRKFIFHIRHYHHWYSCDIHQLSVPFFCPTIPFWWKTGRHLVDNSLSFQSVCSSYPIYSSSPSGLIRLTLFLSKPVNISVFRWNKFSISPFIPITALRVSYFLQMNPPRNTALHPSIVGTRYREVPSGSFITGPTTTVYILCTGFHTVCQSLLPVTWCTYLLLKRAGLTWFRVVSNHLEVDFLNVQ